MKFEGKDLVAIVGLLTNGFLIYCGHNSMAMNMVALIIGWYFGSKRNAER